MNNAIEIEKMASQNLDDALAIIKADKASVRNSRYLAGYSVELMLKAKISKTLNISDLFSNSNYKKRNEAFKTHDLYQLLIYSGIFTQFEEERVQKGNDQFIKDWQKIQVWSSSLRYNNEHCTEQTVFEFIKSCKRFIAWIKKK